MEQWRTNTQLTEIIDALSLPEDAPATRRLVEAFGGHPVAIAERAVGEPSYRSRRLTFASGGEIILHDNAVVAVLLNLAPTPEAPSGLELSKWIAKASNDATLETLKEALGVPVHFSSSPYFSLDGAYARLDFGRSSWNDSGNLASIAFTIDKPGLKCRPEDDGCPTCSDLLVRGLGGVDVNGTLDALSTALEAGFLSEDLSWVRLADLRLLHFSRLMERVESQLTCTGCKRIVCFTLFRDGDPRFGYFAFDEARRRPLDAIPPVDRWGDAAKLAEYRDAMHYVDHEPGSWFLVEQQGSLYLDARYVINSMADDSALIRLDGAELEAYRTGGRDHLSNLARRINKRAYKEGSKFYRADLFRSESAKKYRDAVKAAIVNHTWAAEQRRKS